jgi:hypothetical protein
MIFGTTLVYTTHVWVWLSHTLLSCLSLRVFCVLLWQLKTCHHGH